MVRARSRAGALVDAWLLEAGRSQEWLAREIGVARSVMWRWLVGARSPHIDHAAAIERVTGIPASAWARQRSRAREEA